MEGLELRFEGGRAVDVRATKGEAAISRLLDTDDNARMLGEVALVDRESRVGQLGIVFGDTLLDENAACHIALGRAYPNPIPGASELDEAGRLARGVNVSAIHLDVMIGGTGGRRRHRELTAPNAGAARERLGAGLAAERRGLDPRPVGVSTQPPAGALDLRSVLRTNQRDPSVAPCTTSLSGSISKRRPSTVERRIDNVGPPTCARVMLASQPVPRSASDRRAGR